MRYDDFLKQEIGCPFCPDGINEQEVVAESFAAYLIVAKAPYAKDHLLVIPKKHREDFAHLTLLEHWSCHRLIMKGVRLLGRHEGYTVFVRNGDHVGKTVRHLHFHLVPDVAIGSKTAPLTRRVLTFQQMKQTVKRISKK